LCRITVIHVRHIIHNHYKQKDSKKMKNKLKQHCNE